MFRTVGLKENLSKHLKSEKFEDLDLPLYVAAVNLNSGKLVYFHKGSILDKIQASAAIPILFEPVKIDGDLYIDGGIMDNFPIDPIRDQCSNLIGISLNPVHEEDELNNLIRIAERTFRLSASSAISQKKLHCDIVIEPDELADFGILNIAKGKEMFDLGYRVAKEKLDSI
jgi:NTE family protein